MKAARILASLQSQWADLPSRLSRNQTGRQLVYVPGVVNVDPHLERQSALKASAQCELEI